MIHSRKERKKKKKKIQRKKERKKETQQKQEQEEFTLRCQKCVVDHSPILKTHILKQFCKALDQ